MFPEVSVVIPVRNEAAKIKACIEGILSQTIPVKEIIVVDSGSTDGTLEILHSYKKVQVIEIPASQFNHGETRNVGVRQATGEFVILTVGDAKAYNDLWIQSLLEGFDSPEVAGVCGQQVCEHDREKNPLNWYRPIGPRSKQKYYFPSGAFKKLSPYEKMRACGWDDVTAAYRRKVLLEIPFHFTSFAEDAIWAKEALTAGYAIVYNSAARVYHYHTEDKEFTFKRSLTTFYMRYRHFGFIYPKEDGKRNYRGELSRYKQIFTAANMSLKEKLAWLKYNKEYDEAVGKAHNTFLEALAKGEDALDREHEKYCGKPPIPIKATA
ncbi:MAG: glycosyltransferase [Bacteroidota bacterium]|nr:glycosyltransferase [Bacteroidota bacterium]